MTNIKIELKWAAIMSVVTILWVLLERILGWHSDKIDQHDTLGTILFIPLLILFFFAIREVRESDYDGNMNWMEGFKSGFIIAIFLAVLSPIVTWISYSVVSPFYFENAINHGVDSGSFYLEEATEFYSFGRFFVLEAIAIFFGSLVVSGIACIFAKRT